METTLELITVRTAQILESRVAETALCKYPTGSPMSASAKGRELKRKLLGSELSRPQFPLLLEQWRHKIVSIEIRV